MTARIDEPLMLMLVVLTRPRYVSIENGVDSGAPKWMEWYAAFALTVTLVWLYIEILRLLAKLRRN